MSRKVAVLVGSLRKESFSRKLAQALADIAGPALSFDYVEIGDLGLYSQDLDGSPPETWKRIRAQIKAADAVLFVTPEYNRSVPGVLKNAIDVASRPYGQNSFAGKPGAVISSSPGSIGGFGANHHLRQSLVFLDVAVLQQPEAYISGVSQLFDAAGKVTNDSSRDFLRKFVEAFAKWIDGRLGNEA